MKLTPEQIAGLQRLRRYRATPPTLHERLRQVAGTMMLMLLLVLLLGYLTLRLHVPVVLVFVAGLLVGAAAREIGQQRRFVSFWPLNREITDWGHVDELLSGAKKLPGVNSVPSPKVRIRSAIAIGATFFVLAFGLAVGGERLLAYAYDPVRNNPPNHVIVLSASWCPYCMTLRHHLSGLNIPYTDLDTESTTEGSRAFTSLHGNGTPITIVGSQVIRGLGSATSPWATVDDALKRAGYSLPTTTNSAY